jgi:hypothetical protein
MRFMSTAPFVAAIIGCPQNITTETPAAQMRPAFRKVSGKSAG